MLNDPIQLKAEKLAVFAEGTLGPMTSKTAAALLKYRGEESVCFIDSTKKPDELDAIFGYGKHTPIVRDMDEALSLAPTCLVIAVTIQGSDIPENCRSAIRTALMHNLNIVSGLHFCISKDAEFSKMLKQYDGRIWEIRRETLAKFGDLDSVTGRPDKVVLMAGSDSRVGKRTTAYETMLTGLGLGFDCGVLPTSQTGVMISGTGLCLDTTTADFTGAAAATLLKTAADHEFCMVEGQSGLLNTRYSGLALSVLHGMSPDAIVLCHNPSQKTVGPNNNPIPSVGEIIDTHEQLAALNRPALVAGISLNCVGLTDDQSRAWVDQIEAETGLPTIDPFRDGTKKIWVALQQHFGAAND